MARTMTAPRYNFSASDCREDDERIAYITLNAQDGAFSDIGDIPEATYLSRLYSEITAADGYVKFILTGIGDSRLEKQSVIPTTGDSFAFTATGAEPQVLTITGYLIHDYSATDSTGSETTVSESMNTWFIDFIYLYEYYLRASRLAKWNATMTLTLPDFGSYEGYPLSLNTNQSAESDIPVPFTLQMLVVNRHGIKVSNATSILGASSTVRISRELTDDIGGTNMVNGRRGNSNVSISNLGSVEIRPIPSTADIGITPVATVRPLDRDNVYTGLGIAGNPYAESYNPMVVEPVVDTADVAADSRLRNLYNTGRETMDRLNSYYNAVGNAWDSIFGNQTGGVQVASSPTRESIQSLASRLGSDTTSSEDVVRWEDRMRNMIG